jgi:ATP-dependent exoDNAse (exonuclease V) alpha subunit
MYRLEAKIFSRERRGRSVVAGSAYRTAAKLQTRSVVAGAAYRTGTKIVDERIDKTFDYVRRTIGVIKSKIVAPEGAPGWVFNSGKLWNRVEAKEKRYDAQLAREFVLAVPPELTAEQQFELATNWVKKELVREGMVAEISLHHPKSGTNPHVHILTTMRKLDGDDFADKKSREWNTKQTLQHWRESWCDAENIALAAAGRPERVDHRSLKARGIEREPQPKIGPGGKEMAEKGNQAATERLQLVEDIKMKNEVEPLLKAIMKNGEVTQVGIGDSWWEKSMIFMEQLREGAESFIRQSWRSLFGGGRKDQQNDNSEHTR